MCVRDLGYVRASSQHAALHRQGQGRTLGWELLRGLEGGRGGAAARCGGQQPGVRRSGDAGAQWRQLACSSSLGEPQVTLQGGVPGA